MPRQGNLNSKPLAKAVCDQNCFGLRTCHRSTEQDVTTADAVIACEKSRVRLCRHNRLSPLALPQSAPFPCRRVRAVGLAMLRELLRGGTVGGPVQSLLEPREPLRWVLPRREAERLMQIRVCLRRVRTRRVRSSVRLDSQVAHMRQRSKSSIVKETLSWSELAHEQPLALQVVMQKQVTDLSM